MRLGLWGARMDNSGLGMQTWEFYNAMKPDKTLVVDISILERTPERVMKQHPERYPKNATFIYGVPNDDDIRQFLDGLDCVFVAESEYNINFYRIAREMGVKTACQYNFEFFGWFRFQNIPYPDMFIAPSTWHYKEVDEWCKERNIKHIYLHCPVNRDKIRPRHIESSLLFVHIAGRPAEHDRNGTRTFLEAIKLSEGGLHGLVYTQDKKLANEIKHEYPDVKVKHNTSDYSDMYTKGSVLVIPRKYGGNCLPMNEALAAGMPVIMSKLSPQIDFLPERWLVPATENREINFAPHFRVPVYEVQPADLMFRMLWFNSLSSKDMGEQSDKASEIADSIDWSVMKPKYQEAFAALCLS